MFRLTEIQTKITKFFHPGVTILAAATCLLFLIAGINANAQFDSTNCTVEPLTIGNIFSFTSFVPLIPAECGTTGGETAALTFSVLPIIILRAYGFLSSLVANLFLLYLIFNGLLWMWGGIDGRSNAEAKKNITNSIVALILVLSAYTIVNTLAIAFGIQSYTTRDITSFFTF